MQLGIQKLQVFAPADINIAGHSINKPHRYQQTAQIGPPM